MEGPNCRAGLGIGKSNTPEACAQEIHDFFLTDRCDAILSCGGGETMCEDLSFVDFDAIRRAEPKWFMGYSDNTNLVFPLTVLCDTAAIYGPCAPSFGLQPQDASLEDALALLEGKKLSMHNYERWEKESLKDEDAPLQGYHLTEPFQLQLINGTDGKAAFSGRLLGGCLDCLVNLCGTRYDKVRDFNERYAGDGILWFLEACDLNPMSIRRALWQLEEAGWFEKAAGFLIGRPLHYDDELLGMNRLNAVSGILEKYGVPVVMDLDIGHLPPMMTLISGAMADAEVNGNSFRIDMRQE